MYGATRHDAAHAGFDDARLYEEIARPPSERQLPITQIALPEATAPLSAWIAATNKVLY